MKKTMTVFVSVLGMACLLFAACKPQQEVKEGAPESGGYEETGGYGQEAQEAGGYGVPEGDTGGYGQ